MVAPWLLSRRIASLGSTVSKKRPRLVTCWRSPPAALTILSSSSSPAAVGSCRWQSSSNDDNDNTSSTDGGNTRMVLDRSISIGDVRVDSAPIGSNRPDLIPSLTNHPSTTTSYIPPCQLSHLRWMLQKDLCLQQDFLLLGPSSLARDRRHLLFLYAALVEREIEYVAISKDTSDADLKQRKEVSGISDNDSDNGSDSHHRSVYVNQAPVRAALNGRLLILDGLEKAERNVLPTLNNLLENRELSLDDGGLLVAPRVFKDYYQQDKEQQQEQESSSSSFQIYQVHPDFRVAALASDTTTLDPPLRSRFQARLATTVDPGEILHSLMADRSSTTLNLDVVKELVQLAASIPDGISLQSLHDATRYLEQNPNTLSAQAALNAYSISMVSVNDILLPSSTSTPSSMSSNVGSSSTTTDSSMLFVETKTTNTIQNMIVAAFHSGKRGVAIVGPKGCFKSAVARQLARRESIPVELFSLYSDMTARDLLMIRGTDDVTGNTVWRKTPLARAAEFGSWVILDGIDKVSTDTLTSIALLMEQGQVDLPDGTRLQAAEGFRCIALAHPAGSNRNNNDDWLAPEVLGMFHFVRVEPLPSEELTTVLSGLYPSLDSKSLDQIVHLRDRLDEAIQSGAADTQDEQESLVLSLRKIKHICKRVEQRGSDDLSRLIESALMTSLMPDRERRIVTNCMKDCGIMTRTISNQEKKKATNRTTSLDEDLLEQFRRTPKNPLLVPQPIFEENPGHSQVMADILDAHSVGEGALLIMGFQGVGKNRVVDYLLSRLNCEREYLQLHRDTTVQSLLSSPSIENGRIVYGDSPLVRAAKHGRILVVDEADKAPVEVVALLKGLIEDRELALPDGRTLRYKSDIPAIDDGSGNIVEIHPDFRIWALANPATYPFHGNDISGEMSDVFSCHTVPPLDPESQKKILRSYGPKVPDETINKIIDIWQDLRSAHEKGIMAYPFSVREAVSVTKHLNKFPADGLEGAFENIFSFDFSDNIVLKQLGKIFADHGMSIASIEKRMPTTIGTNGGGISTPKTRASSPKHGKIDENNDPHVGGNTWAGGSGGSDTAGLGGRGGPYRLDSGHPVHQVSDEMKAEVSEEAQRKARIMAQEGLEQKLKDLNMGELDWERYNSLQNQVAAQIQQLQVLLKDIKRRKQERVWLKRQSTGELDDSRLVDALAGEKDVFKKRGKQAETSVNSTPQVAEPMAIKLVVDISASMYRFNGYDGRLQRLLEATLMIMEALKDDDRFMLTIVGHNGDSAEIPLVHPDTPQDPKTQLKVLEFMVAHTQYTSAGDHTVEAMESAIGQAQQGDLVLVISDANLQRYRIDPSTVSDLLNHNKGIHAHLVLIGNFGKEATNLARTVPNQRAQVCLDSEDLPLIIKNIVAAAAK